MTTEREATALLAHVQAVVQLEVAAQVVRMLSWASSDVHMTAQSACTGAGSECCG